MTGARPFGANLVAMVTPMLPDGSIDDAGVGRLVGHLLDGGCDGIVVAGTTGEAPMLDDGEWASLVQHVREAVDAHGSRSGRTSDARAEFPVARGEADAHPAHGHAGPSLQGIRVVAGVGGADTATSVARARRAADLGADGVLVVCPYYVKPSQAGIVAHCRAVADAAALPVMLYDVPHRAGTAMSPATVRELAGHPLVVALKDARGDLGDAADLVTPAPDTGPVLDLWCGIDELNLPYLTVGAAGVVSVVANVAPGAVGALVRAVDAGDLRAARTVEAGLRPLVRAVTAQSQGAVLAKEALVRSGVLEHATVRLPYVTADEEARDAVMAALAGLADVLPGLLAGRQTLIRE